MSKIFIWNLLLKENKRVTMQRRIVALKAF